MIFSVKYLENKRVLLYLDCERPQDPANGHVSLPEGTLLADIALYECNIGYTRVGPSARVCQQSGDWSGVEPYCLVIGECHRAKFIAQHDCSIVD